MQVTRESLETSNRPAESNPMRNQDPKTEAQLQAQCDAWNKAHAVGTVVSFENIVGEGETHRGASTTPAQMLGGHTAVIWLEGKSGCVCLDHCTALVS